VTPTAPSAPRSRSRDRWVLATVAVLAVAVPIVLRLTIPREGYFFDRWDVFNYFKYSAWTTGAGSLYETIFCEYQPLPNVAWAVVRVVSDAIPMHPDPFVSFACYWGSVCWWLLLGFAVYVDRHFGLAKALLLLLPSTVFFVLNRYDLLPALALFAALHLTREGRVRTGALMLGLAIALKGYPLFLAPAFVVHGVRRHGWRMGALVAVLAVAPNVLQHLAVLTWTDLDGMLMPYRFFLDRFNDETSYRTIADALALVMERSDADAVVHTIFFKYSGARLLLALSSVAAALVVWRKPDDLARLCCGVVLVFMSTSVFYSPQYVVWLLSFVPFLSRKARWQFALLSVVTFVYFPLAFRLHYHSPSAYLGFYSMSLALLAVVRVVMLVNLWDRRGRSQNE
jgi:Glycosyltransferase family 87